MERAPKLFKLISAMLMAANLGMTLAKTIREHVRDAEEELHEGDVELPSGLPFPDVASALAQVQENLRKMTEGLSTRQAAGRSAEDDAAAQRERTFN